MLNRHAMTKTQQRNAKLDSDDWIVVVRKVHELNPSRGMVVGRGMSYEMAQRTREEVEKQLPEFQVWAMHSDDY